MAEIGQLPPAHRIPPTRPGAGAGQGSRAPQRKPESGNRQREKQRQPGKGDDDGVHIDEYA